MGSEPGRPRAVRAARQREEAAESAGPAAEPEMVLRATVRALVTAESEAQLLAEICRVLVEVGGFRMAWIGLAEHDEARTVRPAAWAGAETGYLTAARISWSDAVPHGLGPTGTAIRTRTPVVGADFASNPTLLPWRDEALRRGFRSSVALPLVVEGDALGALMIYSSQADAFGEKTVELLAELAEHLAFGLTGIRVRAARDAAARELELGRARLADVERIVHLGSWNWDLETDASTISDELCRIVGVEPGTTTWTNERFMAFVHPDDVDRVRDQLRAVAEDDLPYDFVYRIRRPGGEVRVVRDVGEVVRDGTGRAIRMIGTIHDVTDRIAAEERLRESEHLLAEAQRIARLGSWQWETDTDALTFSAETYRIIGMTPRQFGGTNEAMIAMVHPDDRALMREADRAAVAGEAPYDLTYRIIRPDGSIRTLHDIAEVIRDDDGRAVRVVGTVQDVTDAVAADVERRRLATALEQTAESILMTDPEGTITYVNPAFTRLYGREAEAVIGGPARILNATSGPEFWSRVWEAVQEHGAWSGVITNRRHDGTPIEVESVISGILGPDGTLTGYVQADRDVTRERELEAQLLQAQKMEAVGQLAGGIAHDFNNILTAIRGYADFLRMPGTDVVQRQRDAEELIASVDRAAELTRGLLAFGRRTVLRPESVDPIEALGAIVPLVRRLIGENIELVTTFTPEIGTVEVDRSRLEQVIVNLCVNARDAMPSGGRLEIGVQATDLHPRDLVRYAGAAAGPHVLITVADTGHGMDEETKARIFEPFFTTKPVGVGTGLGLATVWGVVRQSGGAVAVDTVVGQGTTFHVVLPMMRETPRPVRSPHAAQASPAGGTETLLLAEDDEGVRLLASRTLAGRGYTVLVADSGEGALALARSHPGTIDLLVTDVIMPGMAGPDLAAAVAAVRPGTPALFMSGYVAPMFDPTTFGANAFLPKPFTPDALLRLVRDCLDAESPPRRTTA